MRAALSLVLATILAVGAFPAEADVQAEGVGRIGILYCKQVPGKGFNIIIHSESAFDCVLIAPEGRERYVGEAGVGFGLDLEWSRDKTISYSVLAYKGSTVIGDYALTGTYVGAKASVAAGVGLGAQVLAGGGSNNISLQPLALESHTGLGATAGIGYLTLKPAKPTPPPSLDPMTGQAWSAPPGPAGFSYR